MIGPNPCFQIWEHDGSLASMITSAVKDHKNGALYLTGAIPLPFPSHTDTPRASLLRADELRR